MSQAVEKRDPQTELVAQIRTDNFRQQVALALPEDVTPERFVRIAITALQANPGIAELDRQSVMRALLQSAAMGLVPDGREAALVPFKSKAQLIPMIGGYRKIAADYGWTIYTAIVYDKDEFEYEQTAVGITFRHRPVRPGVERGDPIAAYARGKHSDGRLEVEVLNVEEIEKIRATSQNARKEGTPWTDWWEQMAEKSAGKRLFKKLPLSEDDKRVRIVRAALDPADAAEAIYGPNGAKALERINLETGEVSPAPTAGGWRRPPDGSSDQQAGEAAPDATHASPPDSPAPDSDSDPEPGTEAEPQAEITVPDGQYKGSTLADLVAVGSKGEEWIKWALRHPESKNVGPELHAALEAFVASREA